MVKTSRSGSHVTCPDCSGSAFRREDCLLCLGAGVLYLPADPRAIRLMGRVTAEAAGIINREGSQ